MAAAGLSSDIAKLDWKKRKPEETENQRFWLRSFSSIIFFLIFESSRLVRLKNEVLALTFDVLSLS